MVPAKFPLRQALSVALHRFIHKRKEIHNIFLGATVQEHRRKVFRNVFLQHLDGGNRLGDGFRRSLGMMPPPSLEKSLSLRLERPDRFGSALVLIVPHLRLVSENAGHLDAALEEETGVAVEGSTA